MDTPGQESWRVFGGHWGASPAISAASMALSATGDSARQRDASPVFFCPDNQSSSRGRGLIGCICRRSRLRQQICGAPRAGCCHPRYRVPATSSAHGGAAAAGTSIGDSGLANAGLCGPFKSGCSHQRPSTSRPKGNVVAPGAGCPLPAALAEVLVPTPPGRRQLWPAHALACRWAAWRFASLAPWSASHKRLPPWRSTRRDAHAFDRLA